MNGFGLTSARRRAALLTATALLFAACSGAAATPAATAAPAATAPATGVQVKVAQDSKLGAYLTGADGRSLYLLTTDSMNTTTCTDGCAQAWPPLEVASAAGVTAGAGVTGALSTITRADDGKSQVAYNGIPLYYFAKDAKAGDISGQGVKGVWFLVAPASTAQGGPVTGGVGQPAPAAPSQSAPPSTAAPTPASSTAADAAGAVLIANYAFAPASLTVKAGSTVTWTNSGGPSHTVTADNGSFDSGTIASGSTFQKMFTKAGTYAYHCAIHASMTGTITVTP